MALFDSYVIAGWSAAGSPRTGPDSLWLAWFEREEGRLVRRRLDNPPTRAAATALLADGLSDAVARGRTVLAGFDFAFGYPAGLAARLDPEKPRWDRIWRRLAVSLRDGEDNANDRVALAAGLNQALGQPLFWGCPSDQDGPGLPTTCPPLSLPEFRLTEQRMPGCPSPWKLCDAGSGGDRILTGLPRLEELRRHPALSGHLRVWPFETGLRGLRRPEPGTVILAEIRPSLVETPAGPARDAEQVEALARHLARLDEAGRLGPLFAGDPTLSPAEKAAVENEEGWSLGVTGAGGAGFDYIRQPAAIYEQSFAQIRAETDLSRFGESPPLTDLAIRVVHACGMPEVAADLAFSPGAAEAGQAALAAGLPVLVDVRMVDHGIIRRRLPAGNSVVCTLDDRRVPTLATGLGTTRSAAAVELWRDVLEGAVVAIGNAPTALFHLLEMIAGGAPRPALILGFPVGFVGAAESKEALIASGLPHIVLRGRRGGSAMAAAAVNALAGSGA